MADGWVILIDGDGEPVHTEGFTGFPWTNGEEIKLPGVPVPGEYTFLVLTDDGVLRYPLTVTAE